MHTRLPEQADLEQQLRSVAQQLWGVQATAAMLASSHVCVLGSE